MLLRIGQSALRGDIARYSRRFDLLELRAEPGRLPRPKGLLRWKSEVPERFRFSMMLPRAVASLSGGEAAEAALSYALTASQSLGAAWLVLQTPASVTPGARSRARLSALIDKLQGSWRIAWEPRGVWEDDDAERVAESLGVHLVRDLTRQEPPAGDTVYTRLLALGEAAQLRGAAVETLADRLLGRAEAWVVIEGQGAVRAARMLRELCGEEDPDGGGGDEGDDDGYGASNTDPGDDEPDDELDDRA